MWFEDVLIIVITLVVLIVVCEIAFRKVYREQYLGDG